MNSIRLAFATLVLIALPLAAGTTRMQTSAATVTIEGTSTLHSWTVSGNTIQGWVEVPLALLGASPAADSAASLRAATRVTIPAASLRSEHKKMTELMLEALGAKKNPTIEYQLTRIVSQKPTPEGVELLTRGTLTIAGTARDLEMPVQVRPLPDGGVTIRGTAPIRMTDYGMKPPTAMLGTIRTGNEVTVRFEWTVTPSLATASR